MIPLILLYACANPLLPEPDYCGDGYRDNAEECDLGDDNADDAACTSDCRIAFCGDGLLLDGAEECDMGGANSNAAGCTSTCRVAFCGDGLVREGQEECDQGAANADDGGCTSECRIARCGDGLVRKGVEECDDGNVFGGDGCGPTCESPRTIDITAGISLEHAVSGETVPAGGIDVTGDGFDDLVIANPAFLLDERPNPVLAYVVDGPLSESVSLENAVAKLRVADSQVWAGAAVATFDFDGDGNGDVIVSDPTPVEGELVGRVFVVYGPITGDRDVEATADATIVPTSGRSLLGWGIEHGDFDGDGREDLVISEPTDDGRGNGSVYLFFDAVSGRVGTHLCDARIDGVLKDEGFGERIVAGDLDQDGIDDLVVGSFEGPVVHVFYGPISGGLTSADADAAITRASNSVHDFFFYLTRDPLAIGDLNGDGIGDMVVVDSMEGPNGEYQRVVGVFHGPFVGNRRFSDNDAEILVQTGDLFRGLDSFGNGLEAADLNGDGADDLIIGSSAANLPLQAAGSLFVFEGPLSGSIDPGWADVRVRGAEELGGIGTALELVDDVDGDDLRDLLVGAYGTKAYVLPGSTLR